MWQALAGWAFCISSGFLMAIPSCPVNVQVNPVGGGNSATPETYEPGLPINTITIRFINESDYGLDVQFYVAETLPDELLLGELVDALFLPGNKVTAGIGLSGQGIIPPQDSDFITIPCSQAAAVGVLGGLFLGPEGEQMGYGTQRYVTAGNYTCNGVITFYYRPTTYGFETILMTE
ncbi:MAG: hypothetical protein GXY44_10660 [Phycisphaerales bacterium]|nr:hypothetical protein [Phycisphaerales bacterium]